MEQNMKYKGFEQKVECSNSGTGTTATAGSGTSGRAHAQSLVQGSRWWWRGVSATPNATR